LAVVVLQIFLSSPKPALRFAGVRNLNQIAQTHPQCIVTCTMDLDNLIQDSNRSIGTYAMTTLLKISGESGAERLIQQVAGFMGELSDEFKMVVVQSVKQLCLKFPSKQKIFLDFLSHFLREEGGFEYKKAIVEAIVTIVKQVPESKENGLSHLCEFIEDCEYNQLAVQILNLVGFEGPKTNVPSRFIRYLYNRIMLDSIEIRSAAVTSLTKFGVSLPTLRDKIIVLLNRCLFDTDDEVRDRATQGLLLLVNEGAPKSILIEDFKVPIQNLDLALKEYKLNPSSTPFNLSKVSFVQKQTPQQKEIAKKQEIKKPVESSTGTIDILIKSIPEFANFGPRFTSGRPVELTEKETEYAVTSVLHMFDEYMLFMFNCTNTLKDVMLANVTVKMVNNDLKDIKVLFAVPLEKLSYDQPGTVWVAVKKTKGCLSTWSFSMHFKIYN